MKLILRAPLESATFSGVPGTYYGVYDQISRPEESESTNFVNLDADWKVNEQLDLFFQAGLSQGHGKTPTQDVAETVFDVGNGAGYTLHGLGAGPSFNFGSTDNSQPFENGAPTGFGWIFGAENVDVVDKEDWAKIDGTFAAKSGLLTDIKAGARWEKHSRESLGALAQGPTAAGTSTDAYPSGYSNYPSDFENFGGSIPTGMWYWTPAQLAAYNNPDNVNRDPLSRAYIADGWYSLSEKNYAAYVQADFGGEYWSGNIGVRWVQTGEDTLVFSQDASVTLATPGVVTTSAFGLYASHPVSHTYNDFLPSLNLKFDLAPDLVGRVAVAKTMTRADYSSLAGYYAIGAPPSDGSLGNGTGGNPDLKPIVSTNFDAGLEWYLGKKSLLAATLFSMDLENYVGYGSKRVDVLTYSTEHPEGVVSPYLLTVPVNTRGYVKGVELSWQQAVTDNVGFDANYTYTSAKQTEGVAPNDDGTPGDDRLVGASKITYNVGAYYEDRHFSARVGYNYRSKFYSGLDRSSAYSQDSVGYLSASLGYTVNSWLSFTFDGRNLNNPTLKYYALNSAQPRAFYVNGRQFYLSARVKF